MGGSRRGEVILAVGIKISTTSTSAILNLGEPIVCVYVYEYDAVVFFNGLSPTVSKMYAR